MLLSKKIQKLSNSFKNKSFELNLSFSIFGSILEALSLTLIIPLFYLISSNNNPKLLFLKEFLEKHNFIVFNFFTTLIIGLFIIYILRYILSLGLLLKLNSYKVQLQNFFSINLLNYLTNINYVEFKNQNSTDFYTVTTKETEILSTCSDHLIKIVSEFFVVFFIIILLMLNNFNLTIIIFFFILFVTSILYFFLNKKIQFYGNQRRVSDLSRLLILKEIFVFFKELKIYKIEKHLLNYYSSENNKTQEAQKFRLFYSGFLRATAELVIIILFLCLAYLLSNFQDYSQKYFSYILFFTVGLIRIYPSFNKISTGVQFLKFHEKTINYFYSLYKNKNFSKPKSVKKKQIVLNKKNKLVLKNLSFTYPNGHKILSNFSAVFNQGKITGISGSSGRGKTTLCEIILSLIKPTKGSVKLNDDNIFDASKDWFENVSYVSQNSQVFYNDFYYNIALDENINKQKKSKIKRIIKFVSPSLYKKFSNNFNKKIISDGKNLSGGEIQRIAICRALYKNSLVLILDEFTNSLDKKNEFQILKIIKKISKNKIIIIISHKDETLSICDNVINLNLQNN